MDTSFMILAGLIASFLTLLCTDFFNSTLRLSPDASIGLSFTFLFSLGILLVTIFTRNIHIGAEAIMGNIDMIHVNDLTPIFWVMLLNIILLAIFYKAYLVTSFDPGFAKLIQIPSRWINAIMIFQTSITLIAAFRAVGVILVLAFLVVPPVIAKMFCKKLLHQIIASGFIAFLASIVSVALSRHILTVSSNSLSTSGLLVVVLSSFWILSIFYFNIKKTKYFLKLTH
jgi:manganese/zinc/iron transport system permease protein